MQGLTTGCGVGVALMAMMLGGCSDLKKNLGLEREMPNEYNVSPYQKTLEIPPSYDLKPPKQGDARTVAPFKDNPHSKAPRGKLSPAEQALMRDVGPGISPRDQMILDEEAVVEQDQADQKRGPLEGKFLSKKRKVGEVIDPNKELASKKRRAEREIDERLRGQPGVEISAEDPPTPVLPGFKDQQQPLTPWAPGDRKQSPRVAK